MPQPRNAPSRPELPGIEQLTRLLDPLGLLVLTRERVLECFEDAVRRGRMTRSDAQELASAIISLSRQSTDELRADVEQRFGLQRGGARREPEPPEEPIPGYDELTAVQVTARLAPLTPEQLRRVREH